MLASITPISKFLFTCGAGGYSLIFEWYFVENKDIIEILVLIMHIAILSLVPLAAVFSILTIPANANIGYGGMYYRITHSKYDNNLLFHYCLSNVFILSVYTIRQSYFSSFSHTLQTPALAILLPLAFLKTSPDSQSYPSTISPSSQSQIRSIKPILFIWSII